MSKQRDDDISATWKQMLYDALQKKKKKMPLLWFSGSLVLNFPLYPMWKNGPNNNTFLKKFKDKKKVLPEVFLQLIPKSWNW